MRAMLLSLFGSAVALWLAATVVPGVHLSNDFGQVLIVALVFGIVNAFVKPIIKFLALPLILLTLGFVTLLINAGMLMLTDRFAAGLVVDNFGAAFLGALVIAVVNVVLGLERGED